MLKQLIILYSLWCIFFILGFGPSLKFKSFRKKDPFLIFLIAPAFGLGILCFFCFPLYRYFGPSQSWIIGIISLLSVFSLSLVFSEYVKNKDSLKTYNISKNLRRYSAFIFLSIGFISLPTVVGGTHYGIYMSNPSDAFVYMSLSDSTKLADWATISDGAGPDQTLEGKKALVEKDPTALFTARFVFLPLQITPPILMGGLSWLFKIPVYQLYPIMFPLSFALALPLLIALGQFIGIRKILSFPLALTLCSGFWAQILHEHDALASCLAFPLMLLIFIGMIVSESNPKPWFNSSRLFLSLSIAFLISTYYALALYLAPVIVLYLILTLLFSFKVFFTSFKNFSVAGMGALLALMLSGQLFFLIECFLFFVDFMQKNYNFGSELAVFFQKDPLKTFWGVIYLLVPHSKFKIGDSFEQVLTFLCILFPLVLALGIIVALKKRKIHAYRMLIAFFLYAAGTAAIYHVKDNDYSFAKVFLYNFAFFGLLTSLAAQAPFVFNFFAGRLITKKVAILSINVILFAWLATQLTVPVFAALLAPKENILINYNQPKKKNYDISEILSALDRAQPRLLVVNVPPKKEWVYPLYIMFATKKYQCYYQSGFIWDNNPNRSYTFSPAPPGNPDYLLISKENPHGQYRDAVKIVENPDLALYKLNTDKLK